jgi:ammonium transporter, Amt family
MKNTIFNLAIATSLATMAMTALAFGQENAAQAAPVAASAVSAETAYIFNTLLFLIGGFLVMWMAAGFAMLEAGLVRSKNVSMQCLKNIGLYSIAGLMYWLIGYNLMYTDVDGGYFGSFTLAYSFDEAGGNALEAGYSTASDWFFQMVFVATAASIVSGTVAERVKLWPFLVFVVFLTGFIYPIAGSWQWGGGWLSEMGFSDFAGSTLVHSVGGWAALAGAVLLGARKGKYVGGRIQPMPGSSIPLATLGTFILWLGWFGFNGASQLAMGSIADVSDVSRIFANTNLAAASGVVVTMILLQILYGRVDVTMVLNGALAGLVAITAEPLQPAAWQVIIIGGVGGAIVVFAVPLLDRFKIDDVVGAIPVHLFAGIWGTMIVPLSNAETSYVTQLVGVVAYGVFTVVCALIVWAVLRAVSGIRISEEEEEMGLDKTEVGVEAYPEFGMVRA